MIRLFFLGFAIATIVFIFLFYIGDDLLTEYFSQSDFLYKAQHAYLKELDNLIQKENIAATDISRLREWVNQKKLRHFTVSRNRILLYDSSYSENIILGQTESEALHYNWQYFHTVAFSDGNADVYIDANYEMKYYLIFYIIVAILCVFIWIIPFVFGIRKEVKYIQELNRNVAQIELGTMDCIIPIKGKDELGSLAYGLNQMRISLIEKEKQEKQLKSAQDKLVLSMAHDLRTPLTGLMAFLEIAKKQQTLEECNNYIRKAYVKAGQIRDLSNQLFDFFLINSEQSIKLESPENVEYALGEYLSELYALLAMENYQISIDNLYWKSVQIQICPDYIGRIIDNLVSNIKKYADPCVPIKLTSKYDTAFVYISVQNKTAQSNHYVNGTGIGVKNVYAMMSQMNGTCNVKIEPDNYTITLSFPIVSVN